MEGMKDIVNLDINFLGGSAYDDDIGVWNGTGACSTHHGESDCYADLYNLCARSTSNETLEVYWPFTECMFESQGNLCPDSWTGEDCGASAYNSTAFDAVFTKCSSKLGKDAADAILDCAVTGAHDAMAAFGKQLLVDNFATSAQSNPAGKPIWINVDGKLVDEAAFETPDAWGDAVLEAVCSAYMELNAASPAPSACYESAAKAK